ncbi:MAG: DUF2333 family protein [Pseudomonadota bacterium]
MAEAMDRTGSVLQGLDTAKSIFGKATTLGLIAVNAIGVYALVGMLLTERIDDDPTFTPALRTEGGLASVDMMAALIEREVSDKAWVANDPAFVPSAYLRNMQAYQEGIIYALSRFGIELADRLGRSRGATAVDPDLDRAAGLLRFPGDVWHFDLSQSFAPTATSESQYIAAANALRAYNARLAAGEAIFDPRRDNLFAAISRIEADISSKANILVDHVERIAANERVRTDTNQVFFSTKGRLYGYLMVLTALGEDFSEVIEREGLTLVWSRLIRSLENAAVMHPFLVTDSAPGSMFIPSHTAELGFFALRVKTQLRDVMGVLNQN